jgi:3-dehydroquinate synthase
MKLHGGRLLKSLEGRFGPATVIRIEDGERFKSFSTLRKIYDGLFQARADRRSWIVAFGGGVVGDLAGFAAATYMRGIAYVHVPTTLLAQVDSSIGGKVGINAAQGKNLIGAFHQPRLVLSDCSVLTTLPPRELSAGLYEVVKCGAIRSKSLLQFCESRLPDIRRCQLAALERIVVESSRIKAQVVSSDEQETELRMILNYGHTVGHALEAATGYRRFKHGEAVAWGMVAATGFGRELDMLDPVEAEGFVRLIHKVMALPSLKGISLAAVWNALARDKKFSAGTIRMVLLPRLGSAVIRNDIDPNHLKRYLDGFLAGYSNRLG